MPPLLCLCFNFDTARKGMPLLVVFVVLLFQCGEKGSVPPRRHMYFWQSNEEGNAPRCVVL
jgi:hypothetical protein